ncbi:hypothetical protein RJ40_01335 [Methanofollis aquaemaris]|uniref:Uncharacterized protein n=1 Tax=Methanofollis aquaemaris TaxID=126734 RepID=A0A8A3S3Q2_9EURY|nr:hypothetical protein [Methanofollis aquaemaris]QSZ66234.1 hypothetical protein RJ40_01335 [Methanofollis aquaemaris]
MPKKFSDEERNLYEKILELEKKNSGKKGFFGPVETILFSSPQPPMTLNPSPFLILAPGALPPDPRDEDRVGKAPLMHLKRSLSSSPLS